MRRTGLAALLIVAASCTTESGSPDGSGGAGGDKRPGTGGQPASGTGGQPASGTGGQPTSGTGGQPASGTGGQPTSGTGGQSSTGSGGQSGAGGRAMGSNPLSQALIDAFVTAHNQARSGPLNPPPSPALPPVSWDALLADSAYNYLAMCQSTDNSLVAHNANRTSDYKAISGSNDYVGENIYATTGPTAAPADAVTSWMSEASSYDYATNSGSAGHYTQVVWRTSVRIGCAIVNCPSTIKYHNTILCDYAPGGNYTGQKPY